MWSFWLLASVLFSVSWAAAEEVIPARRAHEFADKIVTIEGTVTDTWSEGRNTFLVLGPDSKPALTIALTPPLLLSGFPDQPERFYRGKRIRVRGAVYLFQGRPEMLISDSSRIEVIAPPTVTADSEATADPTADQGTRPAKSEVTTEQHPSLSTPTMPLLPRELLTGQETTVLDLRPSFPLVDEAGQTAQNIDVCEEAQALWRQVTQDLIPHLHAYTMCLEKGSLGCDPEGEKVALGMLGVQQAQKRVRMTCH